MRNQKLKFPKLNFKEERGATTILLSFFVMSTLLMIALTAASIMIYQIQMSKEIANSVPAFYAADAGAEKCLYQARLEVDECAVIGGSVSSVLDNGAQFSATRSAGNKIISWGIFNNTKRQVEITW